MVAKMQDVCVTSPWFGSNLPGPFLFKFPVAKTLEALEDRNSSGPQIIIGLLGSNRQLNYGGEILGVS